MVSGLLTWPFFLIFYNQTSYMDFSRLKCNLLAHRLFFGLYFEKCLHWPLTLSRESYRFLFVPKEGKMIGLPPYFPVCRRRNPWLVRDSPESKRACLVVTFLGPNLASQGWLILPKQRGFALLTSARSIILCSSWKGVQHCIQPLPQHGVVNEDWQTWRSRMLWINIQRKLNSSERKLDPH